MKVPDSIEEGLNLLLGGNEEKDEIDDLTEQLEEVNRENHSLERDVQKLKDEIEELENAPASVEDCFNFICDDKVPFSVKGERFMEWLQENYESLQKWFDTIQG